MLRARFLFVVLFVPIIASTAVRAETPDPFRFVPKQADLVVQVPNPRRLADEVYNLSAFKEFREFRQVRQLYETTGYRRFFQIVAYFEKKLDASWPELLDRLASDGVVFSTKFGGPKAPALLIVQGNDESLLKSFVDIGSGLIDQELARIDQKAKLERRPYRAFDTFHLGGEVHAARAGSALLISNQEAVLNEALDRQLDAKVSIEGPKQARALLPNDPLAWLWANLAPAHTAPNAKEILGLPKVDPAVTILFGGYLDVANRAPFVAAGLYRNEEGFTTTIRLPSGRDGMPEALSLHLPPPGMAGSLPLLEPPGVLYSHSFYLDLGQYWQQRAALLNEKQKKEVEEFNKNAAKFLFGTPLSRLLEQSGPRHRIVVANQAKPGYKAVAEQRVPAFAVIEELRDPDNYRRTVEAALRGIGLLTGVQFNLHMVEEKHAGHTLVGYRFDEQKSLPGDANNFRFNFSPCFVTVGDQFVAASTIELGRDLIDLLDKLQGADKHAGSPATVTTRFYSSGGAAYLDSIEDFLLAQTYLEQALSPAESRKEVRRFIEWARHLGHLEIDSGFGSKDFHYDLKVLLGK